MRLWRITSAAHTAVDGEGARLYGSRWTPRGLPAVYTSATLSLAALERFVHHDPGLEPTDLVAIHVDVPSALAVTSVEIGDLPANWRDYPAPDELSRVGGAWLMQAPTAILEVPSVVIPHERNYIVNPTHRDARRLVIGLAEPYRYARSSRLAIRAPRSATYARHHDSRGLVSGRDV